MKNQKGVTVVELVLYMGLLSVFLVIFFNFFAQILASQTRSASVSIVQTNGNFILTKMTHDIAQADTILSPSAIGSASSTIVLKIGSTNYTYLVSGGRLQINDGTTISSLNDADTTITNFSATRVGNISGRNTLNLNFTITSNLEGNTDNKSLEFHTGATSR